MPQVRTDRCRAFARAGCAATPLHHRQQSARTKPSV